MALVNVIRTASLGAVVVAGVLSAPAGAATLAVDRSCYREGSEAVATGSGFTPNARINFTLNGRDFTDDENPPTSDSTGSLNAGFSVGTPRRRKQRRYVMVASDGTNSGQTAFTATRLDVTVQPKRGNPGRRKRVRARGFDRGKVLRFHVRGPRRRNGKVGKIRGACGKLNKRKRIFRATYPAGVYRVQFDQRKVFRRRSSPRVVFKVRIFPRSSSSLVASSLGRFGQVWTRLD